jgi:hypothetical protein
MDTDMVADSTHFLAVDMSKTPALFFVGTHARCAVESS